MGARTNLLPAQGYCKQGCSPQFNKNFAAKLCCAPCFPEHCSCGKAEIESNQEGLAVCHFGCQLFSRSLRKSSNFCVGIRTNSMFGSQLTNPKKTAMAQVFFLKVIATIPIFPRDSPDLHASTWETGKHDFSPATGRHGGICVHKVGETSEAVQSCHAPRQRETKSQFCYYQNQTVFCNS